MDELRYTQAKRIFLACCDVEPERREETIARECGGDHELRDEVVSLLAHHRPESDPGMQTIATRAGAPPASSQIGAVSPAAPRVSAVAASASAAGPLASAAGPHASAGGPSGPSAAPIGARPASAETVIAPPSTSAAGTPGGAPGVAPKQHAWAGGKMDDQPKLERVGPYKIIHELGRGGMGLVYLAARENDKFRRRVALKVLKRGMDTADVLRRFELERQLLSAMNHPGIARLYDAGETEEGVPYFAMEYVEGTTIDEYCDANRLSIEERLQLFRKVCDAVQCMHQNLIVHRDLKPSNILVTNDGQPKLLDLGIAKLVNPDLAAISGDPTAPDVRVMTPEYASPEQVRGDPITTASDIYSLGVIMYEIVSGHRPYKLKSRVRAELERVICDEDPERPSTAVSKIEDVDVYNPTTGLTTSHITPESVSRSREVRPANLRRRLSGDIDNIVLKAMRKEPHRRYASAEQLSEDIRRHLENLPVIARPDTFGYRVTKFVGRHRAGVAAAIVVALTLAGGVAGTTTGWQVAVQERTEAEVARDAEEMQRKEAEAQRDKAQRYLDTMIRNSEKFLVDLHGEIQQLDGALPARQTLIEVAQGYLGILAEEMDEDPRIASAFALAYDRVGEVWGGIRNPARADVQKALDNYRSGLALRQKLVDESPGDGLLMGDLAASHIHVGDVLSVMGLTTEARTEYQTALALQENRLAAAPQNDAVRRDYAVALGNVGASLTRLGDPDGALELYERSLGIREQLAAANPGDENSQREVALMSIRVARRLELKGDDERALALYERAVEIREKIATANPESARYRRDLGNSHMFLAFALFEGGRAEDALPHAVLALEAAEIGVHNNPDDARVRADLAEAHGLMARIHGDLGDRDQQMEHAAIFRDRAERLSKLDAENDRYRQLVADSYEFLADAFAAHGDSVSAIEHGTTAIALHEALAAGDPDDLWRTKYLARAQTSLGIALVETGQRGKAIGRLEEASRAWATLIEGEPGDVWLAGQMVRTLHALAELMSALQDGGQASAYAEQALDVAATTPAGPSPELFDIAIEASRLAGNDARVKELEAEKAQSIAP